MHRLALRFVVLSAAIIAFIPAGTAGAENAVLPPTDSLPWSDPTHQTPTEQFSSGIASAIAQRTVRVQCHSEAEWAALGLPPNALGAVRYLYSTYTYRIVQTEDIAHLRERICMSLKTYGEAAAKPTRCATTTEVSRTVWETVRVKKKVWYWKTITVKGKKKRVRKSKYVSVIKDVPRKVFETVPGPSVPCYGSGQALPSTYFDYTLGLHVLGHEAVHLFDFTVGAPVQTVESAEGRAECFGMQFIYPVARTFGGDDDDARAIGKYFWEQLYPQRQGTPYWRADCQPNSGFDLSPSDGFWPMRSGAWLDPGPFVWRTHEYHAAMPPLYKNCTNLNKKYPHGLGKKGAQDKTSGKPVTNFTRNTKLFNLAMS